MVKNHSDSGGGGNLLLPDGLLFPINKYVNRNNAMKEMFYLTTHSTLFIYSYMASDIYGKEPFR